MASVLGVFNIRYLLAVLPIHPFNAGEVNSCLGLGNVHHFLTAAFVLEHLNHQTRPPCNQSACFAPYTCRGLIEYSATCRMSSDICFLCDCINVPGPEQSSEMCTPTNWKLMSFTTTVQWRVPNCRRHTYSMTN